MLAPRTRVECWRRVDVILERRRGASTHRAARSFVRKVPSMRRLRIVPTSLTRLLETLRPCFSSRGFDTFKVLVTGLIGARRRGARCAGYSPMISNKSSI